MDPIDTVTRQRTVMPRRMSTVSACALAVAGMLLVIAGCGGQSDDSARGPGSTPSPSTDPCRAGREAPEGASAAVDYISFVRYDGVFYVTTHPGRAASPSAIGPVIGHVACHLDALDTDLHAPLRDGDASFAAKGAAIHAVRGYPHACRIAVRQLGDVLVFSATLEHTKTQRIAPCAR
jgi:hypothetical protein